MSRRPGVDAAVLGIEPLDARSIILSALLGTHPPTLPARAIIALAELFGIRPGTTRTALSRLVARGELELSDGRYGLAGRLLTRQHQQDTGQVEPGSAWDGSWFTAVATADSRPMAERRAFRQSMLGARFAELRPDIWMRPANIDLVLPIDGVLVTHGALRADDVADLVARLWPLDEIEIRAQHLRDALDGQLAVVADGDIGFLPQTFTIAAAVVRFLRTEPQLPAALTPVAWTSPTIREHYDDFAAGFQRQLRSFFGTLSTTSPTASPTTRPGAGEPVGG